MHLRNQESEPSKEYFLCMIMPAKNVEKYISEAIKSYTSHDRDDILLVVIDDHSSDDTFKICSELQSVNSSKILLKKNQGLGKVQAINYGFSLVRASYYKFVDADDLLKESFWRILEKNSLNNSSFVHPLETVTEELVKISLLPMPYQSNTSNKKNIKDLILLPKVTWTFYKYDIDEMFPIPDGIPFEDIWFSLYVYAKNINIINETLPLYLYRQHANQTYGNVKNINEERTRFRYRRIYLALKVIEKNSIFKLYKNELASAKIIALFMLRKVSYKMIFLKCGAFSASKHIILRDYKPIYELLRSVVWKIRKTSALFNNNNRPWL